MTLTAPGLAIDVGEYTISIVGARLAVIGPNAKIAQEAEVLLQRLLETDDGSRLLAAAIRGLGGTTDVSAQLEKELGLYASSVEPSASLEDRDVDPDTVPLKKLRVPDACTVRIRALEDLCAAIVRDGRVDDSEIASIDAWIDSSRDTSDMWPVSELRDILSDIRSDGIITPEERSRLLAFLGAIASVPQTRAAPSTIFDRAPRIEFEGNLFVFTGALEKCTRRQAWDLVESLGGTTSNSPSRKIQYLIVGALGSEAWAHSRYGRKIEAVMGWKRKGHPITIAREADFVAALERNGAIS